MEILKVDQGEFQLARYPSRKNDLLRAWSAADEYLLNYFSEEIQRNGQENKLNLKILILNDSFGALTVPLAALCDITVWTDSWLAQEGILENLERNDLSPTNIKIVKSTESPEDNYDVVLIKIPKSLALLEDQLTRLKLFLPTTTKIIATGMAKLIQTSTLNLFEKYIGTTKTSLAKKKARLIFSEIDDSLKNIKSPYPKTYTLEGTSYDIVNHANVFSREKLDIGTRFFLQHIPESEKYKNIIDLACGNGVVGLIAAEKNPSAEILFLDESFMAIESAKTNFEKNASSNNVARFETNDSLNGIKHNSADLILNNPPFHQDNAIGDEVAWKMFKQSKEVLKEKGELWVIGNRHLAYHIKLKKIFGNCEVIANNKKFVILKAIKKKTIA